MPRIIPLIAIALALGCSGPARRDSYQVDDPVVVVIENDDGRVSTSATTYTSYQSDLAITVVAVTDHGNDGYYSRIGELIDGSDAVIRTSSVARLIATAKGSRDASDDEVVEAAAKVVDAGGSLRKLIVLCDPELAAQLSVDLPGELGFKLVRVQWMRARTP